MEFNRVFKLPVPNTIAGTGFGSIGLDVDGFIESQNTTNPTVDEALGEEWLVHLHSLATSWLEWQKSKFVPPKLSTDRYVAMSLLQKGVRRRDWSSAALGAYALMSMGRRQDCVRRLHIIAMEDVGNGDPDAAALAQMILQSTHVRKELGDVETVLMATRVLCMAWKSRDCTDLLLWPEYNKEAYQSLKESHDDRAVETVQSIALDQMWTLRERISALDWLPVGAKLEVAKEMKCTPSFIYSYEMSAKKSGVSFRHVAPFAALLTQNPTMRGDVFPIFNEKVHGILAPAFDMYTSRGKSSILIFSKLAEVKKWFADHEHVNRKDAILEAVFYVEGGLICPRVMHDASLDLYYSSLEAMMKQQGFVSLEEGLGLYDLVLQFLPRLNRLRYSTGNDRPHDKGVL